MVTLAGGMESDISDDDMVFSTDDKNSPFNENESSPFVPLKNCVSNGVSGNSMTKRGNYSSRGSPKYPQDRNNRNQSEPVRRQCVDQNTSQTLDDLRYAILNKNLATTKDILSKGIWVDTILKGGWTGLMYACSSGHPEIVSFFLETKADPNYHRDMFTPLMAVCQSTKSEEDLLHCCSLLLQHGGKVNARERHYTTPLMFAARLGYTLIVKELLDNGADPNVKDNTGKTALAMAASKGHGPVVRQLIENGADVNICNNMGQLPCDLACEGGFNEVASLIQKGYFSKESSDGTTGTDLRPKKTDAVRDALSLKSSGSTKNYVKIGELELFLAGIDLQNLVALFVEQQLTFHDLLKMDDGELEKMGVTQVGVRKKILEACKSVHKKPWENSSLPNLKQSQYISCPDAVAMMANIAKHLKYISSSVNYIRQQIQAHPRILELSQDSANVHNLLDEMDDGLKNIRDLNDEMRFLKMHLEKVQDKVQYIPADLIVETIPTNGAQKKLLYTVIGMTALSAAAAGWVWRNPSLLATVPTYVRIKLPFLN